MGEFKEGHPGQFWKTAADHFAEGGVRLDKASFAVNYRKADSGLGVKSLPTPLV